MKIQVVTVSLLYDIAFRAELFKDILANCSRASLLRMKSMSQGHATSAIKCARRGRIKLSKYKNGSCCIPFAFSLLS